MGWWGDGVMEGDTPLDYMGSIADRLLGPGKYTGGNPEVISKRVLERGTRKILAEIRRRACAAGTNWYSVEIYRQVAGWLFITRGARLSRALRTEVLLGIDGDTWAAEGDQGRAAKMGAFRQAVVDYDHARGPMKPSQDRGLFQCWAESIGDGVPELLNKGP